MLGALRSRGAMLPSRLLATRTMASKGSTTRLSVKLLKDEQGVGAEGDIVQCK